jgi:phage shock protein A
MKLSQDKDATPTCLPQQQRLLDDITALRASEQRLQDSMAALQGQEAQLKDGITKLSGTFCFMMNATKMVADQGMFRWNFAHTRHLEMKVDIQRRHIGQLQQQLTTLRSREAEYQTEIDH